MRNKRFLPLVVWAVTACGAASSSSQANIESVEASSNEPSAAGDPPPPFLLGEFQDDYGIRFRVTREEFLQKPRSVFHILKWNVSERYLIARNGDENPSEPGLWTRIDWIELEDMPPFGWAFCLSAFAAKSAAAAEAVTTTRPDTPRTGCNGFPFSRMRSVTQRTAE